MIGRIMELRNSTLFAKLGPGQSSPMESTVKALSSWILSRWETIFDGWQPLMEDILRWRMTNDGRQTLIKYSVLLKTTFGRKRKHPSTENFCS